jgi:hypothetical protein
MKEIFRLHGIPKEIIFDRDTKFTSIFWKYLFVGFETKLLYSIAYHPQTDGKIERVNKLLEDILRMHVIVTPMFPPDCKYYYYCEQDYGQICHVNVGKQ